MNYRKIITGIFLAFFLVLTIIPSLFGPLGMRYHLIVNNSVGTAKNVNFRIIWPQNQTLTDNETLLSPILNFEPESLNLYYFNSLRYSSSLWRKIYSFPLQKESDVLYSVNCSFPTIGTSIFGYDTNQILAMTGTNDQPSEYVVLSTLKDDESTTLYHVGPNRLSQVYKPNIYLYSNISISESLKISVKHGFITESDPLVHDPASKFAQWNINLNRSGMYHDNKLVPWLFYEAGLFNKPETLPYGWFIHKNKNIYFLNDQLYDLDGIKEATIQNLKLLGLYNHEAYDFVDYWFEFKDGISVKDGWYNFWIVNPDWIDQNLILTTKHQYNQYRLFFSLEYLPDISPVVELPLFNFTTYQQEFIDQSQIQHPILHEWGVFY